MGCSKKMNGTSFDLSKIYMINEIESTSVEMIDESTRIGFLLLGRG